MVKGTKEAQFNSQSKTKFQIHFQIRNAQTCEERDRRRGGEARGRRQRKRYVKEQRERFKFRAAKREERKKQTLRSIQ